MKSTVLRLPAVLAIPANPAAATNRFLIGAVILLLPLVVLGQTSAGAMPFVTYTQAHAVLEGLTVALSVMIFMLAWSTRGARIEARFGAAGMIFAGIAMLNMAHFLTFPGMPGVDEHSGLQRSLSFWMPTQAMTAAALLAAALLPSAVGNARNLIRLSGTLTLVASGLMLGLEFLRPDWLPVWWVAGSGLTSAKVLGEYLIAIAFAGATLLLVLRAWRDTSAEERTASTLLAWAALILSIGELAFTLYSGVSDWVALLGHFYRITAFLLVYQALFVHGVQLPYQRMADSERTLAESQARYQQLFETSPDGILLLDADNRIRKANPSITRMFGHADGELLGRPLDSLIA
jgi:PAS domain-containing protein